MKKGLVVDANVVAKLFLNEDLSEKATELLQGMASVAQTQFVVPDLLYTECANIFWKHVRRFGWPLDEAQISLRRLHDLGLLTVSCSGLVAEAVALAKRYEISAYDGSYAALAQSLSLPLVTADEKLLRKLKGSGLEIHWLGDLPL